MGHESIAGGTLGDFFFNVTVDDGPLHGLPGSALSGLEARVPLVLLLHMMALQRAWYDESLTMEEQAINSCEFLSHSEEWSQFPWYLSKCVGPMSSNYL